jgi:hypothetical protein
MDHPNVSKQKEQVKIWQKAVRIQLWLAAANKCALSRIL